MPPAGPIGVVPPLTVEPAAAGEQPLPSHVASNSTPKRPAVEPAPVIETTTQFWDGRGVGKVGCRVRLTLVAARAGAVAPLLRLRYIQPAVSPEGELSGGKFPLAVDERDVSGSVT